MPAIEISKVFFAGWLARNAVGKQQSAEKLADSES